MAALAWASAEMSARERESRFSGREGVAGGAVGECPEFVHDVVSSEFGWEIDESGAAGADVVRRRAIRSRSRSINCWRCGRCD